MTEIDLDKLTKKIEEFWAGEIQSETDFRYIVKSAEILAAQCGVTDADKQAAFTDYEIGKWFHCFDIDQMEEFYILRLPSIREAAKERGYALGLHGSMRRDLDLIAIPWSENPSSKDQLAKDIQEAACGLSNSRFEWEKKPCGRYATSFPICWTEWGGMISAGHIDLSLIEAALMQPSAREGWKLVPVEPTEEQFAKTDRLFAEHRQLLISAELFKEWYKAMIAAAPDDMEK